MNKYMVNLILNKEVRITNLVVMDLETLLSTVMTESRLIREMSMTSSVHPKSRYVTYTTTYFPAGSHTAPNHSKM